MAGLKNGFNLVGSLAGGMLLGPLAFLMFFLSGLVSAGERGVKCPFCAEMIRSDAIVCKHCQRDLPIVVREKIEKPKAPPVKWPKRKYPKK